MVNVYSKFQPIYVTCKEVHPCRDDCLVHVAEQFIHAYYASFQMYFYVYLVALLMRGKIPKLNDLKNTLLGILQSTGFLSATAFGYGFFLCVLRRAIGHFNILSISFLPAFIASVFAILIERPSRRTLLCLYVSNVATETVWNMLKARGIVTSVKYGQVAIFAASISLLLTFWRAGLYDKEKMDPMYKILRFIIGRHEEKYSISNNANTIHRQEESTQDSWTSSSKKEHTRLPFNLLNRVLKVYTEIINKIKGCDRYSVCPHPFSCIYYTVQGTAKMFSIGLGIQVVLKLVMNIQKLFKSPKEIKSVLFRRDTLKIASFLGGSCGIFRAVSCLLRRYTGKDDPLHALPAGLLAGIAFSQYPDVTIALYTFWKTAQISYNLGIEKGYVPEIPGFNTFLYCLSTGILFHAAYVEPHNLRSSYWKFLSTISGGRVACLNRKPFEIWGLGSTQGLAQALMRTKTKEEVEFLGCKWY